MEHLIEGSRGEAVVTLKKILTDIGFSLDHTNDYFCAETTQAVVAFQRSVSIVTDGTVGDITWAFLLNVQAMKERKSP